jgi:hypothetical protein
MLSLRDTQRAFLSAALTGNSACMAGLVRENGLSVAQRLQIYANNTQLGLLVTLKATYPVVERLGGTEWFAHCARRYQQQFPSRCGDLQYVGERYAAFLQADLADTAHAYFADVARLEWAYQQALIAADDAALAPEALLGVSADDYENLVFTPRRALRLLASPWPILKIWRAHQVDTAADAAPANSSSVSLESVSLDDGAASVLVMRRADHVELRELSADCHELLALLIGGVTLGKACEQVLTAHPHFDLGANLRQIVRLQVLAACQIDRSASSHSAITFAEPWSNA